MVGAGEIAQHEYWLLWRRTWVPFPTPTSSPPSVTPVSEDAMPPDLPRHTYGAPISRQTHIHIKTKLKIFVLSCTEWREGSRGLTHLRNYRQLAGAEGGEVLFPWECGHWWVSRSPADDSTITHTGHH